MLEFLRLLEPLNNAVPTQSAVGRHFLAISELPLFVARDKIAVQRGRGLRLTRVGYGQAMSVHPKVTRYIGLSLEPEVSRASQY